MNKIKPFKLGIRPIKFKYIPWSQLADPWLFVKDGNYYRNQLETIDTLPISNSRPLKTIKSTTLKALMYSIKEHGLLNPLIVAPIPEDPNELPSFLAFNFHKSKEFKYVIIDGQRRYFAVKKLFGLQTRREKDLEQINYAIQLQRQGILVKINPEEGSIEEKIKELKSQKLNIEDYILIPCLVYPYKHFREMVRHSVEDNKFSVRPSTEYLDTAERKEEIPIIKQKPNLEDYDRLKKQVWNVNQKIEATIDEIREISRLQEKIKELEQKSKEIQQLKELKKTLEEKLKNLRV